MRSDRAFARAKTAVNSTGRGGEDRRDPGTVHPAPAPD